MAVQPRDTHSQIGALRHFRAMSDADARHVQRLQMLADLPLIVAIKVSSHVFEGHYYVVARGTLLSLAPLRFC